MPPVAIVAGPLESPVGENGCFASATFRPPCARCCAVEPGVETRRRKARTVTRRTMRIGMRVTINRRNRGCARFPAVYAFLGVKAFILSTAAAALLLWPPTASAQTRPPLIRGDVSGAVGWLAADSGVPDSFEEGPFRSSLFGTVGVGWHWTDQLKTEIDFGAGTEAKAYLAESFISGGVQSYRNVERRFSQRSIGISQQYQF